MKDNLTIQIREIRERDDVKLMEIEGVLDTITSYKADEVVSELINSGKNIIFKLF